MSRLTLNESAAPAPTPATSKVNFYADTTANPQLKFVDDGGNDIQVVDSRNTVTMTNKTLTSPTLTGPVIGVATGTSLAVTGVITSSSPSTGVGYATGAGLAVTQATNRSTGVSINAICGQITGNATSLAAGAEAIFVVTNTSVGLQDSVILSVQSGPTANTSIFTVSTITAGTFSIRIRNLHATVADTGAPILNYAIIKAVKA